MKKTLILIVMTFIGSLSMMAQSLVATLQHGTDISEFYGTSALANAITAAVDGDAITLSAGYFDACTINKAVDIRGVGMEGDNITYISGELTIQLPSTTTEALKMHNLKTINVITVKNKLKNAYFEKCNFSSLGGNTGILQNANFVDCIIRFYVYAYNESNITFINSIIVDPENKNISNAIISFDHCILHTPKFSYLEGMNLKNSIIIQSENSNSFLPTSSSFTNSIATGASYSSAFYYFKSPNLWSISTSSVFENLTSASNSYQGYNSYILTVPAQLNYLGDDGTEVGIYGGAFPFDITPNYPLITKLKVDSRATSDGKLNVELELK